jgi:hypothetical protein
LSLEIRGAGAAGRYLQGESVLLAITAVAFAVTAVLHGAGYSSSGDDSGVGALVIVLGLAMAVALAALAAASFALGRAVRRGGHSAWLAAIALMAVQVASTVFLWPLALPLGVLGAAGAALLLLPETRAECAAPPTLDDAEPTEGGL